MSKDLWKTVQPRYGVYYGETIDHWNMTSEQKTKVVAYWTTRHIALNKDVWRTVLL